ncbi:MAG: helix-turn-helix domain-containing protein [Firmicutes bacterium]|nr:helix-turn-helix domain-containing protein [Bacillota bacterium]
MYVRIGERIKKAREELRLSQAELGARMGVTATAINYYEKGKRKINIDDLIRLAGVTGKPVEYFLDGGGGAPVLKPGRPPAEGLEKIEDLAFLPVAGDVRAGIPVLAEQDITGFLPFPRQLAGTASFALRVRGDSMVGAGIEEGDLVLIRRQSHVDYEGQIVCAVTGDGETTLKIFTRGAGGKIYLKAANPAFPDIVADSDGELQILGVYAGVFKPPRGRESDGW